jgi:hypothetical protein
VRNRDGATVAAEAINANPKVSSRRSEIERSGRVGVGVDDPWHLPRSSKAFHSRILIGLLRRVRERQGATRLADIISADWNCLGYLRSQDR